VHAATTVNGVAILADGSIATCVHGHEGQLTVWSPAKGLSMWHGAKPRKLAEHACKTNAAGDKIALLDDKNVLICAGSDGNGKTVSVYREHSVVCIFEGHSDNVLSVAAEGDIVASGSEDETIRLWSLSSGACTAVLKGAGTVRGLALRGDDLLSGSADANVKRWSIARQICTATMTEHTDMVISVSIDDDSSIAVSGNQDGTARVWSLEDNACKATLKHPDKVVSVRTQGVRIFTGCFDQNVRIWSLATFECSRTIPVGHPVWSICVRGDLLVSSGEPRCAKVWQLNEHDEASELAALVHTATTVNGVAILADGTIATCEYGAGKLTVWSPTA